MIVKFDIRAAQGGFLSLSLEDPSNGYVVEEIEGLGPVKANLVSTDFAGKAGAQYHSNSRGTRNLVLTLGFDPDWTAGDTVQSLRKRLYSSLTTGRAVQMTILRDDGLEVTIAGRVETCEPTIFAQEPAVVVSIVCFDPDFIDPDPILINGATTANNASLNFVYAGTSETGGVFKLFVDRPMTEFTIYHQGPDGGLRMMPFQAALLAGDVLTISTVSGSKFARLTRGGVDSSILFGVSPQASWIELDEGTNSLRVYAEGAPVPYTFQYMNVYGGL